MTTHTHLEHEIRRRGAEEEATVVATKRIETKIQNKATGRARAYTQAVCKNSDHCCRPHIRVRANGDERAVCCVEMEGPMRARTPLVIVHAHTDSIVVLRAPTHTAQSNVTRQCQIARRIWSRNFSGLIHCACGSFSVLWFCYSRIPSSLLFKVKRKSVSGITLF